MKKNRNAQKDTILKSFFYALSYRGEPSAKGFITHPMILLIHLIRVNSTVDRVMRYKYENI